MDIEEIVCGGVDWIHVAQDGVQYLMSTIMNLRIPRKAGNGKFDQLPHPCFNVNSCG
jgi:hypothetical protein